MTTMKTTRIESMQEPLLAPSPTTPADHLLSARQASLPSITTFTGSIGELVNFDSMPTCASKHCVAASRPALPCPTVSTSCSASDLASATENGGCAGFGVPATCFCSLPNPLLCAWSCDWFDWMLAENWFNATCPQVAPVSFDPVPACARSCFEERVFNFGCITYQKNCFCSQPSLFGCNIDCGVNDNLTIVSWYASVCAIPTASALQVAAVQTTGSTVIPISSPWSGFAWYEIFTIVVGALSILVFLAYVSFWKDIINQHDLQRLKTARSPQRKN
ncbi:hypothetical protein K432DRAFT_410480 [Lepidopterella palustris CBS 459.81]|uniref:Uncharacterized protein n=1 Tax=Lepidopterella palustris CBS 459.81 TaxID=1314670 RepID=A0A8E2J8Z8_9PEZI|nr:hypothetical protein K432DRAFT_410480 [Lepidopterella palustris CBS 459.81]